MIKARRLFGPALRVAGALLLAQVLYKNRGAALSVFSRRPDLGLLALAFVAQLSAVVLTFFRWWCVVRAQGLPLSPGDALRVGFMGNALDVVVPGQVGGDVLKAAFLCRAKPGRRTRALASVAVDRLIGLLGLFVLASAAGAWNWSAAPDGVRRLVAAVWVTLACGLFGFWALLTPALFRLIGRTLGNIAQLRPVLGELHAASLTYSGRKAALTIALGLSTASHTLYALAFAAVSQSLLPAGPGPGSLLLVAPLATLSTVVPLPFGALGLGEQVTDGLFALLGHPSGALAMLGARLVGLSTGLVSLAVSLTAGRGVVADRAAAA